MYLKARHHSTLSETRFMIKTLKEKTGKANVDVDVQALQLAYSEFPCHPHCLHGESEQGSGVPIHNLIMNLRFKATHRIVSEGPFSDVPPPIFGEHIKQWCLHFFKTLRYYTIMLLLEREP